MVKLMVKKLVTLLMTILVLFGAVFTFNSKVFAEGCPDDINVVVVDDQVIISSSEVDYLIALAESENGYVGMQKTNGGTPPEYGFNAGDIYYDEANNQVYTSAAALQRQRIPSGEYKFIIAPNTGGYTVAEVTKSVITSFQAYPSDVEVSFEQSKGLIVSSSDSDFLNSLANGSTSNLHLRETSSDVIYDSSVINSENGYVYIKTADVIGKEGFVNQDLHKVRIFADGYEGWDINEFVTISVSQPKVTFDYSQLDNSKTYTVPVEFGSTVDRPDTYFTDDYHFEGWYLGDDLFEFDKYNKSKQTISSDITLKGKWIARKAAPTDVTFTATSGEGTIVRSSDSDWIKALGTRNYRGPLQSYVWMKVEKDGTIVEEGEWYNDIGDEEYGGREIVPSDDGTYATIMGYEENTVGLRLGAYGYKEVTVNATTLTVTFDPNNGGSVLEVLVRSGSKVEKPEDPTKADNTFAGWYDGDNEYDFDTPVTANLTLKAKWVEKSTAQGDNTMPAYTEEDKKAVADKAEETSVDLNTVAKEVKVSEEVSQKAVSEDTLTKLGVENESQVEIVVETSLNMAISSVSSDSEGSVEEFVIDIEPVYTIKAVNKDDASKEPVVLQSETELKVNKAVSVKIYLPDSFKEGDKVWVKHKGKVLSDENGTAAAKDEKGVYVEVNNPDGFSPFQVSKSKLIPDAPTPTPSGKDSSSSSTTYYKIPKTGIE